MFPLCLLSGEGFFFVYHKWMLNFVKGFLCIYWDNHMVFIFQFVNVVYCIDWLWILKNPCIPGIKPTWSWCMIFLPCCWIWFDRILLTVFACMFIIPVVFFYFLWHLCLVWVLGWWWSHRMSLAVYLPLQFSRRVWVE